MVTGRTLSHYRIGDEISRGGMGIVYEALDVKLNRSVALKVLPPELVADEERKRRFALEAQATAALKHANVAVIYEVDDVDGVTFIAMELIEGETLSALLARGALPFARALQIASEVADGLSAAHEAGIVHRDLKPDNVMVTSDGHAKIIDFGLAKLLEPSSSEDSALATSVKDATQAGQVMGTLAYMSPEQARGEKVDHRSDLFSFGVVFYEVLTGSRPFASASAIELPHAIINDVPAAIPASLPSTAWLQWIAEKCLAKNPRDRYQSARDLFLDLGHVERSPEASETPTTTRPIGAHPWLPWVIAGAAGVLAFLALMSSRPTRDTLPRVVRTTRLTHDPGLELDAAISPDGTMTAYAKGAIGRTKIFVQQVSGGRPVPLTAEFPGSHYRPRFSPDGAQIAFSVRADPADLGETGTEIYVVPALGGAARRIVESGSNLAWSPNGAEFAYVEGRLDQAELNVASADGTRRETLASLGQVTAPAWSPQGDKIAYAVGNSGYLLGGAGVLNIASSSIWLLSPEGGEPTRLTEDLHLDSNPQWMPDGRHLLFVSDRGGTRDVYWLTLTSSGEPQDAPKRLTTGLQVHSISLSSDGKRLVYSVLTKKQNIWSLPIPSQGTISASDATPVTVGTQEIEGMAVSADGKWLAFDSNRSGNQDIYKVPIGGGELVQLTTHPSDDFVTTWSPDGSEIMFYSLRSGNRDIYVMSSDGGSVRQITRHPGAERYGTWSPDGKLIAFESTRDGGVSFMVPADGSAAPQLLEHAASFWSPDGRWLLGGGADRQSLIIVSPDQTEVRTIAHSPRLRSSRWAPDSRSVFYKTGTLPGRSGIWSIPLSGGEPRLLVRFEDFDRPSTRREFAVDNERIYFTLGEHESDVWVMDLDDEGAS